MPRITEAFFCSRKFRFIFGFLLAAFFFFFFGLIEPLRDFGKFVTLSIIFPVFLYFFLAFKNQLQDLFKHKSSVEVTENLELTELAKKENPQIAAVLIKKSPKNDAYSMNKTKIVMSSAFFSGNFSEQEINALLYHEIAHTTEAKENFLIPALIMPLLWIGVLSMFIFFEGAPLFLLFLTGAFLVSLYWVVVERLMSQSEFRADIEAAKRNGSDILVSALLKTVCFKNLDCDSPTHPSINRRISAIQKRKQISNH